MNRKELIDSLPEWLRERADELLRDDAVSIADMKSWDETNERFRFWHMCSSENYENALADLKQSNPEVYQKYYAKYFDMKDSQYTEEEKKQVPGYFIEDLIRDAPKPKNKHTEEELNQLFPKQLPVEHTEEYKQRQALWKAEQDRKQLSEKKDADKYRKILVSQLLAKGQNSATVTQILKQYDVIIYGKP